jgi:hypothetical protein
VKQGIFIEAKIKNLGFIEEVGFVSSFSAGANGFVLALSVVH